MRLDKEVKTLQKRSLSPKKSGYFFSRLKNFHKVNGQVFITLYARLTIVRPERHECVWEALEEVTLNQVNRKLQNAPNGIYTYQVPEEVFQDLKRLSEYQQNELYSLAPLYQTARFSRIIPSSNIRT